MAEIPSWLNPLVEVVAQNLTVHGPAGELGLRYREVDDVYDVLLYPLPVEMVGGAHDGGLAAPGFALDLHAVLPAFAKVDAVAWDAHGTVPNNAETGPCLSIEGTVADQRVWLRLLAYAPEDVRPAGKVDGTGHRQAG